MRQLSLKYEDSLLGKSCKATERIDIFSSSRILGWLSGAVKKLPRSERLEFFMERALEFGFGLFIFSLILSPNLIGIVKGFSTSLSLYLSDILLSVLCILLILKKSFEASSWQRSSLDIPFFFYISFTIFSTARGILIGTIDNPFVSMLYLVKNLEYVIMFYLALNIVDTTDKLKRYLFWWFGAAAVLSAYGIYEHFHPFDFVRGFYRIYERGLFFGQANHFAGFLMFMISLAVALIISLGKKVQKMMLSVLITMMFFALLWTYSRQVYFALFLALSLIFLLKDKRLLIFFLLLVLIAPIFLPESVTGRIQMLVTEAQESNIAHSTVAIRLHNWGIALSSVKDYPLMGVGLGARHRAFYDSNFVLVISELGFIGLLLFIFFLFSAVRSLVRCYRQRSDIFIKAVALGCLGGLIGIVAQGFFSVSFIISRIAGPLFCMLGMVLGAGERINEPDFRA